MFLLFLHPFFDSSIDFFDSSIDSSVLKVTNFILSCFIIVLSHFVHYIYIWFFIVVFSFVSNLSSKSLQACIFTWRKVKVASWTSGPCSFRRACSLPSSNGRQGGALILRGRAAMVVEYRVPFLVESELFRGQVRCHPVEKCSLRWSHKQGQLVRMIIYLNMFLS